MLGAGSKYECGFSAGTKDRLVDAASSINSPVNVNPADIGSFLSCDTASRSGRARVKRKIAPVCRR